MNPRRFIANSAPDALNPSVGIFSARSKRLTVRSVSFATNLACSRRDPLENGDRLAITTQYPGWQAP